MKSYDVSIASRATLTESDVHLYVALAIYVFYSNDAFVFIGNGLNASTVTTALYSLTYIILILIFLRTIKTNIQHMANAPALIALYIVMILSIIWSIDRPATLGSILPMILSSLLCFYLGATLSLRGLIIFFGVGAGIVALLDVLAVITIPAARGDVLSPWPDSWRGLHNQKNALGETSSFALLACIYLAWLFSGVRRMFFVTLSLLSAVLLYQSDSRSAQIVTLGILLLGLSGVLARDNLRNWLVVTAVAITCLVVIVYAAFVTGLAETIFVALDRKPTMSGRIPIWEVTLDFIDQRPILGYGHNAFWDDGANRLQQFLNNTQIKHLPYYSHNGFLEITLSFGLVGIFIFICILIGLVRNVYFVVISRPYAIDLMLVSVFTIYFVIANVTEVRIMTRNSLWIVFAAFVIRLAALGAIARASQEVTAGSIHHRRASELSLSAAASRRT